MAVPFLDLVSQFGNLRDEMLPAIERILQSAQFILGEEVELFEEKFAAFCGAEHCVGLSSGTEALHLALRALEIGPGDEVITVANTFAATAFAIAYTGADPVFVDVRRTDYNLDTDLLEQAISSRTKAIVPVHLYGQPADMDAIMAIAEKHGLRVVEDACQAHGALSGQRPVGALGDVGCFSFYPGKNLGAYGDGGAVVTNNAQLADKIRLLRNYGQRVKNEHSMLGYNARLDALQAAILLVKLNHLADWNERRRGLADSYREALAHSDVILPSENVGTRHVYHLFVIQHDQRDDLRTFLEEHEVYCGIHYPVPLPEAAPFQTARSVPDGVPVATELSKRILSLPMFPEMTAEQVGHVADAVASFSSLRVAT